LNPFTCEKVISVQQAINLTATELNLGCDGNCCSSPVHTMLSQCWNVLEYC